MSTPQAVLSQLTGITFAGEDDPRIQNYVRDLCDDFRLDALRLEAAAEARLLEEVERIRQHYCAPVESIDYHYRLLATDRVSPTYFVGSRPPQALELMFHQPAAADSVTVDEVGPTAVAATTTATATTAADIDVSVSNGDPDALPDPPAATTADDDGGPRPAPLQRSRSLQEEFACCICLNLMYEPTSLVCGHSGCLACMKQAMRAKPQCPVCKARSHHELTVTIALRTAIKRLCPDYGPPVDAMPAAPTAAVSLAGGVDLRGSLDVVCRHLDLHYEELDGTVKFVLSNGDKEVSFTHANLPFRRLLEDSRMVHPVYAEGVVEQNNHLLMQVLGDETPPCPITAIPAGIVDTLVRPLLLKAGPHRDWVNAENERFQSALAAITGVAWEPFQSSIPFLQWLPRRLMQKLCRRGICPMETPLALMELRTELRKFLEALLTVAHELQKHRKESVITCDTLIRSLPRLYSGNRADLRVFGYGVAGNIRHVLGAQLVNVLAQVHPTLMMGEVALSVVHDLIVTAMLDVARTAKAHSMQSGRLSATLKCGDAVAGEEAQCRSWEYSVYEVSGEGSVGAGNLQSVVTFDEVLVAIRTIIGGDLARHAISEGAKAKKKYHERNTGNRLPVPGMEMRHWAGLVLAPESIALIVDTHFGVGDMRLTVEALIGLTALTEYLSAELLELSGNAAKDLLSKVIFPHHLSLAIIHDEELNHLYPGMIRYRGHADPAFHGFNAVNIVNVTPNAMWMQSVDEYLASRVSTGAVVPHLLCGRYVGPNHCEASETDPQYMLMPVLDCLAYPKLGEAKRQLMAIEAAPVEVQQAVERMGPDVATTWRRRILELRREQRQRPMFPLFTHETMFALSGHVMQGLGAPTVFTTEAIDLLASVSESFMISVVNDAYLQALLAKRYILEPNDIQAARRLRGERA